MAASISIKQLIQRFWQKTIFTWLLVILEGLALVLMPLSIGWAVDDLLQQCWTGIAILAGLCSVLLVVGAGRRFYDTRVYAAIYTEVAGELVQREQHNGNNLSSTAARVGLLTELVQFLEDSVPSIFHQGVNLIGTLIIILFIDWRIFSICLLAVAITWLIYSFSAKKIYQLNQGSNNELEQQVEHLKSRNKQQVNHHFRRLMRWQIRLSDLETINFSLVWIALTATLIYAIVAATLSGNTSFGQVVAIVMYVFGFIGSILEFPLYYQQLVRLQEIAERLTQPPSKAVQSSSL